MTDYNDKKERLERALYNWLDTIEVIEQDILDLIDHNNVSKSTLAKHIDTMKNKLITLENNLRRY